MARKDKRNSSALTEASAPELQQILHSQQQPAHNPYYPDPTAALLTPSMSVPPPPYSPTSVPLSSRATRNSSVPMSHMNNISYPRIQTGGAMPVVIHSNCVLNDYRADRYSRGVRAFTTRTISIAILSILLSIWAYSLYDYRECIESFVVAKFNKDTVILISDIRRAHLLVACAGGFLVLLCLLKSAIGFRDKSHSCFLFLIGLFSLVICIHTVSLSYLAFYSPCAANLRDIMAGAARTALSNFAGSLPSPDDDIFGQSNVFNRANEDRYGLAIFLVDVVNVIFYFSTFLSAATSCY